jgi:hypothetical protein
MSLRRYGPGPLRLVGGLGDQGLQSGLVVGIAAGVEAVLVERLLERVDLCPGRRDLRLAHLAEVARRDEAGEQADDHHHHEQLEQREAARAQRQRF